MIEHDNLEEFADPQNYDIEDSSDVGVSFYAGLAQETGGPVLEIACGTGRVSIPIAKLGLAVTGVDIVPGMLQQARLKSHGLPVRWVLGDARSFALGARFKLVFLTGNAFQAFLTRADQEALLAQVREHLDDEGLFAFETRNPRWATTADTLRGDADAGPSAGLFARLESRSREQMYQVYTDKDGHTVTVANTQTYDHVAQVLEWTTHRRWHDNASDQARVTRIAVRYTFPQELEALLHYNGFALVRRYGDWDLSPLTAGSPSTLCVCRKRQ